MVNGHGVVSVAGWSCGWQEAVDADGVSWILQEFFGWFDSPSIRADPIPRPGSDGSYDGSIYLESRTVRLDGTVVAHDEPSLLAAMDRAAGVLAGPQRFGTLVVDESTRGLSRQAVVRLDGPTLLDRFHPHAARFSMSLFAADPRRYSTVLHTRMTTSVEQSAGRDYDLTFDRDYGGVSDEGFVTCVNAGTVDTFPVIIFAGPLTNPSARLAGGGTLTYTGTISAGQEVRIDNGTHAVTLGSASRRQYLTDQDFFALPPGASQVLFQAGGGTGTMTVAWRDAW